MASRTRSRTPVTCACPRARHVHGTYPSYAACGCGCDPCSAAATQQRAESRTRLRREGPAFVPIEHVREHVEDLRAHGLGTRRLAEISGVSARLIQAIVTGTRGPRDGEQHTVNRKAAAALMKVRPSAALVAPSRLIDATGTRRRLQALLTIGWSRAELARQAGLTPTATGRLMLADSCTIHSARKVHTLYEELWDQAPPTTTGPQRQTAARARADARARGWVSPMSWDDDTIDDPTVVPSTIEDARVPAMERLDELLFLARAGTALPDAARRVGYSSWSTALRTAQRHDHPLARIAERLELERAA